ncbi:hypothetical protein LIPSTDRAFT_264896 [Lipomyces starkeyi NRRL Y-11557]|uniref:Uncharacterized protein n=1 Tax=Lipomyces starkeyi NRRL Y-11557 TaxID=675824 RepID=A0A1E3Q993_LIPST|nr:hypothetical protein LIPSTDRAFT_264896 [Lipomyces starkeyi NRRL Y-11557]
MKSPSTPSWSRLPMSFAAHLVTAAEVLKFLLHTGICREHDILCLLTACGDRDIPSNNRNICPILAWRSISSFGNLTRGRIISISISAYSNYLPTRKKLTRPNQ